MSKQYDPVRDPRNTVLRLAGGEFLRADHAIEALERAGFKVFRKEDVHRVDLTSDVDRYAREHYRGEIDQHVRSYMASGLACFIVPHLEIVEYEMPPSISSGPCYRMTSELSVIYTPADTLRERFARAYKAMEEGDLARDARDHTKAILPKKEDRR